MFGFYYLYKGPKQSLLARYDSTIFVTKNLVNKSAEEKTPGIGHLFDDNLNIKFVLVDSTAMFIEQIITPNEINSKGDLGIEQSKKQLLAAAYFHAVRINLDNALYIKDITKPKYWYERLTVRYCVENRLAWVKSLTLQEGYPFNTWEKSTEDQVRYLLTVRALPHYFDWVKTMKVFKDVYPKPLWWEKEYRQYKQLVEGK